MACFVYAQNSENNLLQYAYFVDSANQFSENNLEDIPFTADKTLPIRKTPRDGALWISVKFLAPISQPEKYVFSSFQDGDTSAMYFLRDGKMVKVSNLSDESDLLAYLIRFPVQAFEFPKDIEGNVLYFRFNYWVDYGHNPILIKKKDFARIHFVHLAILGIGTGILVMIIIHNLWYLIYNRRFIYLLYCLYASALTCLLFFYFWFDYPFSGISASHYIIDYLILASSFLALWYCMQFLELKKVNVWLYRAVVLEMGLAVLLLIFLVKGFVGTFILQIGFPILLLGTVLASATVAVVKYNQLYHKFYLAGGAAFLISMIAWSYAVFEFEPVTLYVQLPYFFYGIVADAVLLWMGLNTKIANEKREAELAKLQAQEKLVEFQQTQNRVLEAKVKEQTIELQTVNDEITAQNEELTQLNEELEAQRNTLSVQNRLIEQQNFDLQKVKEGLEETVAQRTHELTSQNLQLEQFAFMTAHNLREPVAHMLGLTQLFTKTATPDFQHEIISKVQTTAGEFDAVLKDLSTILEVKKGIGAHFDFVPLEECMEKVMRLLAHEIGTINPAITTDFQVKQLYGIEPYITSIFYNLISNSLKFRKEETRLQIALETRVDQDTIVFTYTDNGIGFDMQQAGEKVFQPFRRFHLHRDGKGLGLYLIKIQADTMQAHTALVTAPDKGFMLRLAFPKEPAKVR